MFRQFARQFTTSVARQARLNMSSQRAMTQMALARTVPSSIIHHKRSSGTIRGTNVRSFLASMLGESTGAEVAPHYSFSISKIFVLDGLTCRVSSSCFTHLGLLNGNFCLKPNTILAE
eukprot:TRINITY_DN8449_c0_g1_i1.p1 TRINITY_DN8449_c0_g1~~TRINITY_DN8449_c0_g1_i1.p1  ORF type:complete len:131 (+),score=5.07 TRINITY_DN8449_c0_g1_i1:42-395(+)